jgi:carbonic anhydrase/acetyltransferase-like protein (isoleucine patch superfamily)
MSSNVFIADGVEIVGDCSIGAESVVFPQVRFKASNEASVVLGERNVIEEKALVEDSMCGGVDRGSCLGDHRETARSNSG